MSLFISSIHNCSCTVILPPTRTNYCSNNSSSSSSSSSSSCLLGAFILSSSSSSSSSSILSLPSIFHHHQKLQQNRCCCAVKTGKNDSFRPDLLKKPVISSDSEEDGDDEKFQRKNGGGKWVDWEDQILEDTVPLVGFVRMILHSGKYQSGDRLAAEHEKTILERLLPFHPECDKKIGCGVDYITIGYHPQFQDSRCLFIFRKDGELVDFSYWKCIKGLIRKNYPHYADSFILKHFRRRRRHE